MVGSSGDVVSLLHGITTGVSGRFKLTGRGYALLADSGLRGGGPGEEIGSLDLLVASLVVCALNVVRKDQPGDADEPSVEVECLARVTRDDEHGDSLGALSLHFKIPGLPRSTAQERIRRFQLHCRVYRAIRSSMDISFLVNGQSIDSGTQRAGARTRHTQLGDGLPDEKLRRLFFCD